MRLRSALLALLLALPAVAAWHGDERVPIATLVPVADDLGGVGAIVEQGDHVLVPTQAGTLWRVDASGATAAGGIGAFRHTFIDVDAEGNVYSLTATGLLRTSPTGEETPVARINATIFGPNGELYVIDHKNDGQTTVDHWWSELWKLSPDRRFERVMVLPCCVWSRAFAPDGTLYAIYNNGGELYSIDLAARTATFRADLGALTDDIAVDMLGRVYVSSGYFGNIERWDPATGETVLVANGVTGARQAQMAWIGARLFVTLNATDTGEAPGEVRDGVAYVQTDAPGFVGYHPHVPLAPLADLATTILSEAPVEGTTERELTARVENVGGSWLLPGTTVRAERFGHGRLPLGLELCVALEQARTCDRAWLGDEEVAPAWAPGEARTFVWRYDASDIDPVQTFVVEADPTHMHVEADEGNNEAVLEKEVSEPWLRRPRLDR